MQSFKQYIFESVEIVVSKWFDGEIPISIKPKTLSKARVDLHKVRHLSKATTSNTQHLYRGIFDVRSGKFYIWYAEDALHGDVAAIFNLINPINMTYNSKNNRTRLLELAAHVNIKNKQETFIKFLGKKVKIQNVLKPMEWGRADI